MTEEGAGGRGDQLNGPTNRLPSETTVDVVVLSDQKQLDEVHRFLREYNQRFNAERWSKLDLPEYQPQRINFVATDRDGRIVGGLCGETTFAWLKIDILAVSEEVRRRGVGRQLVERAEVEARQRGCRYAYVDTMDYQSPEFYTRLGFEVTGSIGDWDSHGHRKFFLTKTL